MSVLIYKHIDRHCTTIYFFNHNNLIGNDHSKYKIGVQHLCLYILNIDTYCTPIFFNHNNLNLQYNLPTCAAG